MDGKLSDGSKGVTNSDAKKKKKVPGKKHREKQKQKYFSSAQKNGSESVLVGVF